MKTAIFIILVFACARYSIGQEIRIGLLIHDIAPVWGNEKIEGGIDGNIEIIFGKGIIRPNLGLAINSRGNTNRAYFGVVAGNFWDNILVEFGLGICYQVNAIRNLGSAVLFRIAAEIGYRWGKHSISLILDHISNAGLADYNAGLDVLGLRYGYKF